jgi:hypothetical protein
MKKKADVEDVFSWWIIAILVCALLYPMSLIRVATYFDGPTLTSNAYMNQIEIHCTYYTSVGHFVYWLCPTKKRFNY